MIEIPVPPFRTIDEAKLFHRLLLVFLRELKTPDEPVSLHLFLLATALGAHGPAEASACGSCGSPYPCRTVLQVVTTARFPAPWAPKTLFEALTKAGLLSFADSPDETSLAWEGDPRFGATRGGTGEWTIVRSERGTETSERLPDDAAMVSRLCDHVRRFPFPFAWRVEPEWVAAVRPGVEATGQWWEEHSRLPYLKDAQQG